VRSKRSSIRDSARFLWAIYPDVFESGVRGRFGTIRFVLARPAPIPQPQEGLALLVDHNSGKLAHAERVFGVPFALVDPLAVCHRWRWRVLLLLACLLPARVREVVTALIHVTNLARYVRSGQEIFLWNPYTLLQFAVDELLDVKATYHLSASYPALRRVKQAHGCSVALEVLGYEQSKRVEALQPWRFGRTDPILAIYLSQLDEVFQHESELSLLAAVRAWRYKTLAPIEIFIHYTDRERATYDQRHAEFFREFGDLVSDRDSLVSSSTGQISLSALSTIGLDLLSMEIAHFVVAPEPHSGEPTNVWQARLDPSRTDLLRATEGTEHWLQKIRFSRPDLFREVFRADITE